MRRLAIFGILILSMIFVPSAHAQKKARISIATGGTGGVYYPLGGAIASVLSKYVPTIEATAEVTSASVDNCKLIGAKKAELALTMTDAALDAFQGVGMFKEKIPLRTICAIFPNSMHIVTVEGKGINKALDLKGKRVSTGSPGSATEVQALRILEAYGIDPNKDLKREKLGASESAGALKDRKIDAYFWSGGYPTSSVTDLASTPGYKIKLIPQEEAIPKMRVKYGKIYSKGIIPARTYAGQDSDVAVTWGWALLVCHEKMEEKMGYDIVKTLFDQKPELVIIHREAAHLSLDHQADESPLPFHSGALRYYAEKGLKIK